MSSSRELASYLDDLLRSDGFPDYAGALNGLQLDHQGPVRRIATAVDYSRRTVEAAIAIGANFLVLHHGMFWSGAQHLTGYTLERLRLLIQHDIAVYASHLPLDANPTLGNNTLLATELGLVPSERFGKFEGVDLGVAGEGNIETAELLVRAQRFSAQFGGMARTSMIEPGRRTRRWAIITGAGAGSDEIREAQSRGIDTLIVGEGPHYTTVDAPEAGLVIVYAGHYATETLGVRALAQRLIESFGLPSEFLNLPTGS